VSEKRFRFSFFHLQLREGPPRAPQGRLRITAAMVATVAALSLLMPQFAALFKRKFPPRHEDRNGQARQKKNGK